MWSSKLLLIFLVARFTPITVECTNETVVIPTSTIANATTAVVENHSAVSASDRGTFNGSSTATVSEENRTLTALDRAIFADTKSTFFAKDRAVYPLDAGSADDGLGVPVADEEYPDVDTNTKVVENRTESALGWNAGDEDANSTVFTENRTAFETELLERWAFNHAGNLTALGGKLNVSAFDLIASTNGKEEEGMSYEVDMRFPPVRSDDAGAVFHAPIKDHSALWPGGVIPYELGIGIRRYRWFVKLVRRAMDEWEAKTCIKFRPKTEYDVDYVHIIVDHGCNSDVGKNGGRQTVSLGAGCAHHSVVLHELGHVVGFWHEQNRPDRDKFVRIIKENIMTKFNFAFHKYSTHKIDSLGVPYDYKSIMHYGKKAFSKNGQVTIVALDGKTKEFGNDHLSVLDIMQTNRLYKCPDKSKLYPIFPDEFKFSFSTLSRHRCTRLYEPLDRYWNRNVYLCMKSGKKPVKLRWSYRGPIRHMTCTRIYSPTKYSYRGWSNNYLCVPKNAPYDFKWSIGRALTGYKCLEWKYTRDRSWGSKKFLCSKSDDSPVDGGWSPWSMWGQCTKKCSTGYQRRKRDCTNPAPRNGGRLCGTRSSETRYCNKHKCSDLPSWPEDFTFRYHRYTPYSSTCIRTYERSSYFQWTNYYFCSRSGRQDINMKWSDSGPIRNMKCVLVNEPSESRRSGWHNNYLCVPKSSPYNFKWSHRGRIRGLSCVQWYAKKGHEGWNNNYLCASKFKPEATETMKIKINGGWSSWGSWSLCSKTCGIGSQLRFRSCSKPHPSNGGRPCQGNREIRKSCLIQKCPIVCGKNLRGARGTFRSPNMGPGRTSCTWTINVPVGQIIKLRFQYFNLGGTRTDCRTDYVGLRDGRQSTSPVLRKFCTTRRPQPVQSGGNVMWIQLKTSNNIYVRGFTASWQAVSMPTPKPVCQLCCGGDLSGESGEIVTPNYPLEYPRKLDCIWNIKVSVHKVLKLRFLAFDLERHSSCKYDYVEIRDGLSIRSPELGTYCGTSLPKPLTAFANSLRIKFHSDASNPRTGFKAIYYTETRRVVGGRCPKKWRYYVSEDGSEYCYLIRYKYSTWNTARSDCRRRKSDLLSIATSKEQWFVRNELMAETKYYELWMGYNDRGREGRWTWSDRSEVAYSNWAGGDPNNGGRSKNEDCGVLKPDGKWNDFPCNHRFMYICKKKISCE